MKKIKEILYMIRFCLYGVILGVTYNGVIAMLGVTAITFSPFVMLLVLGIVIYPIVYMLDSKFVSNPKTI